MGVGEITSYRWRPEFGELKTAQAKRLKDLELEKGRGPRCQTPVAKLTSEPDRSMKAAHSGPKVSSGGAKSNRTTACGRSTTHMRRRVARMNSSSNQA